MERFHVTLTSERGCMRVYSLLDRKLKEYGPLVLGNTDEAICRALMEGFEGVQNTITKYPRDFDLMFLGTFDAETGALSGDRALLVANVGDLLNPVPEVDNAGE